METTSITPQESISSPATIHATIPIDKFSHQQVDAISDEKKDESLEATLVKVLDNLEEASVSQNQVHASKLEPSLQIPKDSPNVCENAQAVVGCEHQRSFRKNIRMDVVNGDVERSQRVMSITKTVSAHQVFDTMCQLKRLKPKHKRKLSLSPKSRMFKFKNKMLQRNRSQMDPHHVMDSNLVTYISSSSRAKFGFKWQEHNSRYWRRMRQTRLHMRHRWKSKHLRAVVGIQNNPSYALDVVPKPIIECNTTAAISQLVRERSVSHDCFHKPVVKHKPVVLRVETGSFCHLFSEETSKPWRNQQTFTSKPVASVHSLSFAVGTAANWSSGLSQNRQVWEPGGVLADHVLEDNVEAGSKGLAYAGCVLLGMNCAGLGSGKEELLATGQQMQRTDLFSELTCSQNKKQMLGYKTRMFKYKSSLRITRSASRDMNQFVGFMKFQLKHKWRSKHLHTISALGFYLSSVFSTVPSATSGRLQGLLEQVLQKDDEAYPQILDKLQLNLKQGMDVHGASGLRLFLCQQKFSSIWHRWRRKDSDLEVQLKERALVQSSVSPELLDEAVWIPEVGCRELLVKWQDHDASENFWMFSKDFVQLYPSSKLEDKLVFEGGSIDTIKQSYYRKKKPWVETEGFSCKEALEGNGGFAVSLEV